MVFSAALTSKRRFGSRIMTAAIAAAIAFAAPGAAQAKTYLVNGILSATAIGYGFKNLKKKIPGSSLFLMVTGIEAGSIRQTIVKDIRKRHAADPTEQFTLAGISAGANVVLQVAQEVAKDGIPIHYLAIVEGDGGSLPGNVANADNFICAQRGALCNMKSVSGANTIRVNTGHIDMGNSPEVHNRVVANAR
ncbi:MAG: hypothetical protein KDJ67_16430 [Nitratireductor sp.]|nr:hypothetical protein [Nitratireductor sp.]